MRLLRTLIGLVIAGGVIVLINRRIARGSALRGSGPLDDDPRLKPKTKY
jgi:hypothetical protein